MRKKRTKTHKPTPTKSQKNCFIVFARECSFLIEELNLLKLRI